MVFSVVWTRGVLYGLVHGRSVKIKSCTVSGAGGGDALCRHAGIGRICDVAFHGFGFLRDIQNGPAGECTAVVFDAAGSSSQPDSRFGG
jgi:hypothetical protein